MSAVSEFVKAATPGNNPAAHNMAGVIICDFKRSGLKAMISSLRGLCMNALHRSRDLEVLNGEVRRDGVFNREVAATRVRANDMGGFEDFDPSTEQGRQPWVLLQELVVTLFGRSADRQLSEDKVRAVLDGLQINYKLTAQYQGILADRAPLWGACCVWLESGWTRRTWTQDPLNSTLNSNSGRGSVTRIEINVPPLGNLLLLGHGCLACMSTVSIKTSEDNQLHEEAHARHRPFQEMFKAEEEGGGSLLSPSNQQSSRRTSSSSLSLRCGDSFLPGQGIISGLR